MSLETAARLQNLDLMARQISTQISGDRRPAALASLGFARIRSSEPGRPRAEENILALRPRLDEAETPARRHASLPSLSQPRAQPGDSGPRRRDENAVALKRGLEEAESLLRIRTQELHGERLRSQGDEQRAQNLLLRTRTLLEETRDQLAAAQKRAEEAEEYLCALYQLIRVNLDFGRANEAALTPR